MADYASAAAIGIVVPLVLAWLIKVPKPNAFQRAGVSWVEYGWAFKALALFFSLIVIGLIVAAFLVKPDDKKYVWCMVLLFGGLTIPLLFEFFFVKISFDGRGIKTFSPWKNQREIPWAEVVGAEFSASLQWWSIRTLSQGVVRAHLYLSGLDSLLSELLKRHVINAQQIAEAEAATKRRPA